MKVEIDIPDNMYEAIVDVNKQVQESHNNPTIEHTILWFIDNGFQKLNEMIEMVKNTMNEEE